MSVKVSIIDTHKFDKLPDGYKTSPEYVPKRLSIPLYVQSQVAAALPYDTRRLGDKPPKLDLYTALLEVGMRAAIFEAERLGFYNFTNTELAIPETSEDVIWIPRETVSQLNAILEQHNTVRVEAGLPKLTGTAPIICALLRKGLAASTQCKITTS